MSCVSPRLVSGRPRTAHRFERDLQLACGTRNWALKPHKTVPRSVRDHRSRDVRIHTLNPQQATHLYVRLHRHPVGVIQLHETYVPKIPKPERNLRDYIPLSKFVQYKSFFDTINPNEFDTEQAEETLSAMENWITETNDFARESDPRCLPFHVFSVHRTRYELDTPDGRNQLNRDHGPQKSREDRNGLDWERAHDMHGREVLHIWGHQLGQRIPLGCYPGFAYERLEDSVQHDGDLEDTTSWPRQRLPRRPYSQGTELSQGLG